MTRGPCTRDDGPSPCGSTGLGAAQQDQAALRLASPDAALVRAARTGDRAAFGRLHNRHAGMVFAILLARVPRADADDLVQDVFLIALQRLDSLRDDEAFGGWLATIARHAAAEHHRRKRSTQELPDDLPQSNMRHDPMRASPESEELLDAVRSLPLAYSETLLMRFVQAMTGPEIAARTGLTEGSVRVNLHRGMQMLKQRMGAGEQP